MKFDEPSNTWLKTTKGYGLYPEIDYKLDKQTQKWVPDIFLAKATPRQYFRRMNLQNKHFGDTAKVEAVTSDGAIVIRQENIKGVAPSTLEIAQFFRDKAFKRIDHTMFYNAAENIAIFDAHEGNLVIQQDGSVFVIDVITVEPKGELKDVLTNLAEGGI